MCIRRVPVVRIAPVSVSTWVACREVAEAFAPSAALPQRRARRTTQRPRLSVRRRFTETHCTPTSSSSSSSSSDSDGQLAEQVVAVPSAATGNESVPIQLAQCWFTGLEAILSNSTRKLLRFEIAKMLIAV